MCFRYIELNTAITFYCKSSNGIRNLATTLPVCTVEHSNHYNIETRFSTRWYTTHADCQSGLNHSKGVIDFKNEGCHHCKFKIKSLIKIKSIMDPMA